MLLEKKTLLKKKTKNETVSLIHSGVEKGEWDGEGKFNSPKQSVSSLGEIQNVRKKGNVTGSLYLD